MALTKEEIKKMTGQQSGERTTFYKLNEAQMSGDDGAFSLREILGEKGDNGKYPVIPLGAQLSGVILKMRWKLSKYKEGEPSINTTEYDNKYQDTVTVYPAKEKGNAAAMKEKYGLSTQRVIYMFLPARKEIVRLIVKASALGSEKNVNKELGLFDYIDEYNDTEQMVHEYITECVGVYRAGQNADGSPNKRKDHCAMTFKRGRKLEPSEVEKVETYIQDVHEKTANPTAPAEEVEQEAAQGRSEEDFDRNMDEALGSDETDNPTHPAHGIDKDAVIGF